MPKQAQRRFVVADVSGVARPLLCVTIDAEESFDWSAPFCRGNVSVGAIAHLRRGHEIFRRYGVKPTYLVDYPVVDSPLAQEVFGPWLEAGECLVGAHLHPWVNPPHEEVVCLRNTYPCNLPERLERAKLRTLTRRIVSALKTTPRVYRAGRYGVDLGREEMLSELGYLVDTSVVPFRSYAGAGGGPNFFGLPDAPFWSIERGQVLFLPVTQSLVGPLKALAKDRVAEAIFGRLGSRLRAPGVLARLGLLERIMLTPEGVTVAEMQRLLTSMAESGRRVFSMSMHSPSFLPGGTPYARSAEQLDGLLRRIEAILDFFFAKLGGAASTPLEVREMLAPKAAAPGAGRRQEAALAG